ncbi:MAG: hypothetical protein GXP62_17635 [Oligoflexia bacterium]|nr:hypothetical protein [Oligoflexia bacterium]
MVITYLSLLMLACAPTSSKVGSGSISGTGGGTGTSSDGAATTGLETDGGTADGGTADGGTDSGLDGGGTDSGTPDGGTDGGTEYLDLDGDGVTPADGDCNDGDAEIGPFADEGDIADGVDQDCTGTADDRLVCPDGVADYQHIQQGIDDAPIDFVLRICPGEYDEDLAIVQRVTLVSTDGADVTIVRGTGAGPVLQVNSVPEGPSGQVVGVQGLTLTGGQAVRGGGLLAMGSSILVQDDVIDSNLASDAGGGAWLENCFGSIIGTTVSNNTADQAGGLGVWGGSVEIRGNTVQSNTATTTDETTFSSGSGGGGLLVYGDGPIQDNTIDGNQSGYNGGGLYLLYGAGQVTGNTISGNTCSEDGAGAYFNQVTATVTDNLFYENLASDDAGGLRCYICSATFTGNQFLSNQAADDGGGMKASHATNLISDNWFEANQAGDAGGGLELDNETSDVSGSTFLDNVASRGAGMHSWRSQAELKLEDLYFQGNQASTCGGAMQLDNDSYLVNALRITAVDNTSVDGGAVCTLAVEQDDGTIDDTRLVLTASLLAGNQASDDGGAVFLRSADVSLVNVTIADSVAGSAALYLKDGGVELNNTVISGTSGGVGIQVESGELDVTSSDLWDNEGGPVSGTSDPTGDDGNLGIDPSYVDSASGDYSLDVGSGLIDLGDPEISDTDGTRSDMGYTGGPDAG